MAPQKHPGFGELLGDMYARWVLDPVIEIAFAVSKDFVSRPDFYTSSDIPDTTNDLRVLYGYARGYPNKAQRQDLNSPLFGASDGYAMDNGNDRFRSLRRPLFAACVAFSERTVTDVVPGLRQRVLSAAELFRSYLLNFDGVSVRSGYQEAKNVSDLAYNLLRRGGVSQVFGISQTLPDAWPLSANDPKGAQLIRAIGEKLQLPPDSTFNEDRFGRLRRVAQEGSVALALALAGPLTDQNFDKVVAQVYSWSSALKDYSAQTAPAAK